MFISEYIFWVKYWVVEWDGGLEREFVGSKRMKEMVREVKREWEGKGSVMVVDGEGVYLGLWVKYKNMRWEEVEVEEGGELGSDEEEVEEEVVGSGIVIRVLEVNL